MSEDSTSTTTTTAAVAQSSWSGPCSWPVSYAWCSSTEDSALSQLSPDDAGRVERMAIEYLWNWTNQQFGLCETTIRPCRSDCFNSGLPTVDWERTRAEARGGASPAVWGPIYLSGHWQTIGCSSCGSTCTCVGGAHELVLPGEVSAVSEVVIDGVVQSPLTYEFRGNRYLTRLNGEVWPSCQNLTLPLGQPNTWSVTLLVGVPVPEGGQMAAGLLAEEFAKALCRDKRCALPQRWQTITRQGVTITSQDLFEDLEKGHTGIWLIDSWVASTRAPRRHVSSIRSPDYRPGYRRI